MVGVQVAAEAANNTSIGPVTEFSQSVTSQLHSQASVYLIP